MVLIVAGDFLKTISRWLQIQEEVQLKSILSFGEFSLVNWFSEWVKLFKSNLEEVGRVGAGTINGNSEKTWVSEVAVNATNWVNKVVILNDTWSAAWVYRAKSRSAAEKLADNLESRNISMTPWNRFESNLEVSWRRLGPRSVFSTDVFRGLASVLVFWDSKNFTEAFLNKFDILGVVLYTWSNNKALLRGNVIQNKLLKDTGIKIVNVAGKTVTGHTEGVITESSLEEQLSTVVVRVEFSQVVFKIVGLLVLRFSNVCCKHRSWLKSNVNQHLEHINSIVFKGVTTEIHRFLVIVHLHISTWHLNHTVVNGLVGVLQGLKVSVLEGEEGARCFLSFISGTNTNKETYIKVRLWLYKIEMGSFPPLL